MKKQTIQTIGILLAILAALFIAALNVFYAFSPVMTNNISGINWEVKGVVSPLIVALCVVVTMVFHQQQIIDLFDRLLKRKQKEQYQS